MMMQKKEGRRERRKEGRNKDKFFPLRERHTLPPSCEGKFFLEEEKEGKEDEEEEKEEEEEEDEGTGIIQFF